MTRPNRMPARQGDDALEAPTREEPEAATRPRVLVVDDVDRNLLTVTEVLKGLVEVDCARSGEEALRFLLKGEYAVILLDVLMPGLDGYQTAALIRQRESSKATPIIFLTAINKEDAIMLRGYDAGAVDVLFKPFDPFMLRSKVAVFVELFQKNLEIRQKAAVEQRLLQDNLRANAEKLEAVRDLRRAAERQEAILRSLPMCIHSRSVEPPYATVFVSEGVEGLTGFPPAAFTDDPPFGLNRVHPDDRPVVTEALESARRTGAYACEFRWLCANGEYRHFLDQGVVSRPEDGPAEILGTLLDITERRHLENQLIHAQKLDAIGKLTGGIAHDFNNLIASIESGLNLLRRKVELSEDAARILSMTQHAATQGANLIGRMLAFSRRQNLNPQPFDVRKLSESLDSLLSPVLGGRVTLQWEVAPDLWPAIVDPGQLELSVMNLVINARDAMEDGGSVLVKASNRTVPAAEPELAAGDYVVIRVEDNGTGIAPEHLAKVLEPFFTTKDVGRGTGLGLSTAYGFARQSGGALRIESAVGRGTAVELWLPRAEGEPERPRPPRPERAEAIRPEGAQPTILLVDDAPELLEFTARQLRERGFEVVDVRGGAEALALVEKQPQRFDLIITDFAMPLVSGVDVIRFARTIRAGWPAIIVTGYADHAAIRQRPADVPVLYKPFQFDDLLSRIAQLTGEQA